jgi:hypothetical protein
MISGTTLGSFLFFRDRFDFGIAEKWLGSGQ